MPIALTFKDIKSDLRLILSSPPPEIKYDKDDPLERHEMCVAYIVHAYLTKGLLDIVVEYLLVNYNWGCDPDYYDKTDSSMCLVSEATTAIIEKGNSILLSKLWRRILNLKAKECRIAETFIKRGKTTEEDLSKARKTLIRLTRLLTSHLEVYKKFCGQLGMNAEIEFIDSALKKLNDNKVPSKIFE